MSRRSHFRQPGESAARCKGAARRNRFRATRPVTVHSFPHLQQLPDENPAPVGIFGPGWKAPSDIHLQLRDNELILNDNGGRSIHFEHLFPGEDGFSRSELFWLVRGGVAKLNESHRLAPLWQALPEELRLSPHIYLATNSPQGPWWILGWSERVPGVDEMLPAPLPPYRVLTGTVDRFGRTLTFRREAAGEFTGKSPA